LNVIGVSNKTDVTNDLLSGVNIC